MAMEKDCDLVTTLKGSEYIRVLTEDGVTARISVAGLATVLSGLIPLCYTGWTSGSKLKLTKGACSFVVSLYNSAYLVSTTGSKGASVTKLGGEHSADFREDSSGNVYVFAVGIYFIQRIGYNASNIMADEISDYPPDCTAIVVK